MGKLRRNLFRNEELRKKLGRIKKKAGRHEAEMERTLGW